MIIEKKNYCKVLAKMLFDKDLVIFLTDEVADAAVADATLVASFIDISHYLYIIQERLNRNNEFIRFD